MFSLDNPAFIFSAGLLAIALILAGLVMLVGNGKSAAEMPDQAYEAGATNRSTSEVTSIGTAEVPESGPDLPEEETVAEPRASGAVKVSFTVVSSQQQEDGQD